MAASSTTIQRIKIGGISTARRVSIGVIEILIGVFIYLAFARNVAADALTKFVMTPGGMNVGKMADWIVPSQLTLYILIGLSILIGIGQLIKGYGKATNGLMGIAFLCFIFAFLTWQASGKSLNLAGMLSSSVLLAVPITLGAFTGILCERAGVVNIAIEGMMLMAAMIGALMGSVMHSLWWGLLFGVMSAVLLAALHAVLSIKYKIDQIISGTVINIFSTGMTAFISQKFMQVYQELNNPGTSRAFPSPGSLRSPWPDRSSSTPTCMST